MLFDAIEELAHGLKQNGHVITIETAGTIFRDLPCDLMSLSPKLANSTPMGKATEEWVRRHEETRLDLGPLRQLVEHYDYQLKFVVNPEKDLEGQLREIDFTLGFLEAGGNKVLLMAEGTDSETLTRRERLLAPVCMKLGYRLSPRLHIHLYGNTRGT